MNIRASVNTPGRLIRWLGILFIINYLFKKGNVMLKRLSLVIFMCILVIGLIPNTVFANTSCATIGRDISITVPCAELYGVKYAFKLNFVSGSLWQLDLNTLRNSTESQCMPMRDNLDFPVTCAELSGTTYSFTFNYAGDINWMLNWDTFREVVTSMNTPTGLKAEVQSSSSIRLSWNSVTSATGYNVYVDGKSNAKTTLTNRTISSLSPSKRYCFRIEAYDSNGNVSPKSTQVCATTKHKENEVKISITDKCDDGKRIHFRFFADRNGNNSWRHAWPNWNEFYYTPGYNVTGYYATLTCQQGERICYGANPQGRTLTTHDLSYYWGMGVNGTYRCTKNCWTCGTGSHEFGLLCTAPESHRLTVSKSGTGSGTVTSSPSGINCGSTCSASFNNNTTVTLTARSATGSTFAGWSGDCSGSSTTTTVTINSDKRCTATFNQATVTTRILTVNSIGATGVRITATPSNYAGTTNYDVRNIPNNTSITLTAPATSGGANFSSWTGCNSTSGRNCTVNMSSNKTVRVNYQSSSTGDTWRSRDNISSRRAVTDESYFDIQINTNGSFQGNIGMYMCVDIFSSGSYTCGLIETSLRPTSGHINFSTNTGNLGGLCTGIEVPLSVTSYSTNQLRFTIDASDCGLGNRRAILYPQ